MRADDDGVYQQSKENPAHDKCVRRRFETSCCEAIHHPFLESGIVVIKHWKIHNYIQKRPVIKETVYQEERSMLDVKPNNSYTLISFREHAASYTWRIHFDTICIQPVSQFVSDCIHPVSTLDTQVRLGKDRVVEDSR